VARKKQAGGGTPATLALTSAGIAFELHHYEHDPRAASYGLEAADALGVEHARVFKTLLANLDGTLVVGIVPVAGQLDLKALARALGGSKAAMAEVSAAERATGYVAGGISPSGRRSDTGPCSTSRPGSTPRSSSRVAAGGWTWKSRRPTWSRSPKRSRPRSAGRSL
jgi:Cys-tRNA(Pro)/Cys-tRNA(Cys) deacylase